MRTFLILAVSAALLSGLLWAETSGFVWLGLFFKAPLSMLFVLLAMIRPRGNLRYFRFILAGLILGLIGDVCLALPWTAAFQIGLIAFLLGHLSYVLAFTVLARARDWINPGNLLIIGLSLLIFLRLLPYLEDMTLAVSAYILVISVMVAGAWAVFRHPSIPRTAAWFILIGAACFYCSDIFVAEQRFVTEKALNRLLGLPLYYSAQFLLAASASLTGHFRRS